MKRMQSCYIKVRRAYLRYICSKMAKRIESGRRIGLVSSDLWKQRVSDDLLLQKAFLDAGIKAEIISWQDDKVDFSSYDVLLITSMWGYQNHTEELEKWFQKIEKLNLVNRLSIVRNSYDKTRQFALLQQSGLPVIPTVVVKKANLLSANISTPEHYELHFPIVVKPAISSGGDNTFLAHNEAELQSIAKELQSDKICENILLQPFISEISNGEISVVLISGQIVNAVVRFPGVLSSDKRYIVKPLPLSKLSPDLIDICGKISEIKDYREAVYMRVDVVEKEGGFVIMEVETFEPQLFYYLLKGKARKKMLSLMVQAISACYNM